VKYAAFVGAAAGIAGLVIAVFVAAVLGLVTGLVLVAVNRSNVRRRIPFGPFLSAGGLAALVAQAVHWPPLLTGGLL